MNAHRFPQAARHVCRKKRLRRGCPFREERGVCKAPGRSGAEKTRRNPCGNGACAGKNTTKRTPGKSRSVLRGRGKERRTDRTVSSGTPYRDGRTCGPRRQQGRPRPAASERPCKAPPKKTARTFCRHERRLRPHGRQGSAEILSGGRHSPAAFIRKTRSPGRVRFFWKNKEPCPPAPSAHPASSFPPGSGRPRPR